MLFRSVYLGLRRRRRTACRAEKRRAAPSPYSPPVLAFARSCGQTLQSLAIITDGEIPGRGCASGKCNSVTRPAGKPRERARPVTRFKPFYRPDANFRGGKHRTSADSPSRSFFIDPSRSICSGAEKSARFYGILRELKILCVFALLPAPGNMRTGRDRTYVSLFIFFKYRSLFRNTVDKSERNSKKRHGPRMKC